MNREWLIENGGYPIKYSLTQDVSFLPQLTENEEVAAWLGRLTARAAVGDLGDIHGSHDYRYENIIGKCYILGLNANVPQFDSAVRFFVSFLDRHITNTYDDALTFGKMYQYRDYETVMACYMPFLVYGEEKSVQYVAQKRADILHSFTSRNRYDVYRNDLAYPGANKAWKPFMLDPELYKDGNIAFPSIHDLILFAGMYGHFDAETRGKVETTVKWLFGDGYSSINHQLYFYAPRDPAYKSKSIHGKVTFQDFTSPNIKEMQNLLFRCFILSHFSEARKSAWFGNALTYLDSFKTPDGRYVFPKEMIVEQKDTYVHGGGHMSVGESKKNRLYAEIVSTYWMEKILTNV
jgi:hypothetical protein